MITGYKCFLRENIQNRMREVDAQSPCILDILYTISLNSARFSAGDFAAFDYRFFVEWGNRTVAMGASDMLEMGDSDEYLQRVMAMRQ